MTAWSWIPVAETEKQICCREGLGLADLVAERRDVKRGVQDHSCVPDFVTGSTAVPLAELWEPGGGLS